MSTADPTRIDIDADPTRRRMRGVTNHGLHEFDVPFVTPVAHNLWQGGCTTGLRLPADIKHVVSLYPWERYETHSQVRSELYVTMYDSVNQDFDRLDVLAAWVNECREDGPTLVHCQAGLNRSALVAARAINMREGYPGRVIIVDLRHHRSLAVLCNPAFEREVMSWE